MPADTGRAVTIKLKVSTYSQSSIIGEVLTSLTWGHWARRWSEYASGPLCMLRMPDLYVTFPAYVTTHCAYPRKDGQAELTWQLVTYLDGPRIHALTGLVVNSLIKTSALQATHGRKAVLQLRFDFDSIAIGCRCVSELNFSSPCSSFAVYMIRHHRTWRTSCVVWWTSTQGGGCTLRQRLLS